MKKGSLAALLAVLALGALAVALFLTLRPTRLPDDLIPPEGRYDVRILRDNWGVPHIFGRTDADVAYGLAWAHAEDDFATIQGVLLAARGQLASVYGRDMAPNDFMVHLLRIPDVIDAGYAKLSPETRAICEAYADGLNHYAALHPDEAVAGLYPAEGRDLAAGFVHKVPLFFGIDNTLKRLFSEADEGEPVTRGSNAFAVGPTRSEDGSTFLGINSHQPWDGPVAWYEAHLVSEEGWDAVGGVFPGAPVILHGHNRHLGWAHTVNHPDLLDVYDLETDDKGRYKLDGEWRHFEKRLAPLKVKLFGPISWTFKREVLFSKHGPAVQQPNGAHALRFAGYGETRHLEQWYRMNKANNFDEWRDAMRMQAIPMFNTVYADREGNVFYVYNGKLPKRTPGHDYSADVDGTTSETLWNDHLSFDELPQTLNPPSGFVMNCNHSPFVATDGTGNADPALYPPELGIETHLNNRALRSLELYGADSLINWTEFLDYKHDTAYSQESRMAAMVATAVDQTNDPEARTVLAEWNLDTAADNESAALALLAFGRYVRDEEPPSDEALLQALDEAATDLREHFGGVRVPLGEVLRLRRGDTDLALSGGPDVLRAIYGAPGEDGRLVANVGDSYILMVAWDKDGNVSSESIHQFGSATLDAQSPHFDDQAPLFARQELKPVLLDEAAIRAHLKREYRPGA